jgi:putative DNA primase/helicase
MDVLTAALELLASGFRPIPVDAESKKPPIAWKEFQARAPQEAEVRRWWAEHPGAGVAILTGGVAGVDVLDLDVGRPPDWPAEGQELPTACIVETPSGGLHYYFKHIKGLRNSAGQVAPHVDVRGDGGYIVVPPSCRGEGAYVYLHGSLVEARDCPAPEWLCKALSSENGRKPHDVAAGERIPKGQRNGHLTSLAGSMRARGMTAAAIEAALLEENSARCAPPLAAAEVQRIAASVGRYEPAQDQPHLSDLGNGERFARQHGARAKWVREWGWIVFDGAVWRRDPEAVERLAKETARSIYQEITPAMDKDQAAATAKWAHRSESQRGIMATLAMAQSELAVGARPEQFDRDPYLLNCLNGTLDLRTGELGPHDPADFLSRAAGAPYRSTADCPTWRAFLARIFEGNPAVIEFVQRAVGYSLTGDTGERCLFFCYGTGANGKSTLLETLQALLGDYALQADVETFFVHNRDGASSDIARLDGARLVAAVETGESRRLAESLVKQLTGRDTVSARFLFHEFFQFRPEFKIWLIGNHKPVIRGTDNAIWDRIRMIPFTVTIPESERDPALPDRLRAELPGILRWAVQGALAWQRDEGLHPPAEVRGATAAYRDEMDTLASFIEECCLVDSNAMTSAKLLYSTYAKWTGDSGERPMTKTAFGSRLKERGFKAEATRTARMWFGLRLPGGSDLV